MKNLLILTLLLASSTTLKANEPWILEENIQYEFGQLNRLEKFLNAHPATLAELQNQHSQIIENVNFSENRIFLEGKYDDTLGIPPFFWGCIFGIIGILMVFLLTDDKSTTKKAVWGCVVSYGSIGVLYIIFVILSLSGSFVLY